MYMLFVCLFILKAEAISEADKILFLFSYCRLFSDLECATHADSAEFQFTPILANNPPQIK